MKKGVFTFIAGLMSVLLFAQEGGVREFSLKEAVDFALQNNNAAKNAKLDMKKAKAFNWEILTQGLPQLNGSFEYDYYFKTPLVPAVSNIFSEPNSPFVQSLNQLRQHSNDPALVNTLNSIGTGFTNISFVLPNDISTGLTLTQLFFDARYMFGIQARKELYLTSRLSSELTDNDIRNSVTKAYYQAETAQEAKSLLLSNQKIIDKLLSDTRAVFAQGLTEELDVNRLELVQANLQSQVNQQNSMAEVALANLKFQMGLSLDEVIILKDKLDELKSAAVPQQSKFDPQNRIEYQLLSIAITLKGYDVSQKRSGYYPSIAGFLNYSGNVQTQAFSDMFKGSNWFPQGIVGLKLNVPIFDSGLKYAQVQQTKLDQLKQKNDFENFKNAAKLQYQSALSTYNAALADEVTAQKTLDLSQKIFDKNQIKFKQGAGTSFELEQSEQEFTTNQLKQVQSVMNLLNAKADLDKAMGVK
jgi:outer membrane protein